MPTILQQAQENSRFLSRIFMVEFSHDVFFIFTTWMLYKLSSEKRRSSGTGVSSESSVEMRLKEKERKTGECIIGVYLESVQLRNDSNPTSCRLCSLPSHLNHIPPWLLGFDRTIRPDKYCFQKIVQMISFNWDRSGIVPPIPDPPPHSPARFFAFLTAQRANLRWTLAPALTHCQTKTEVILFSLNRVSEAWGKSHHPWRTTGVLEK